MWWTLSPVFEWGQLTDAEWVTEFLSKKPLSNTQEKTQHLAAPGFKERVIRFELTTFTLAT
jgi:hypothetical protein